MNEATRITADVDPRTLGALRDLARARGITESEYVAEAVRRVTDSDMDFQAFIQVGIDAADRGDTVPHAQVMAELDAMIDKHRGRCAE